MDDDARAETVAALDDLKERLAKAETASEQYRKHNEVLQSRLEDALKEQAKLEERQLEGDEQIEVLRHRQRETERQNERPIDWHEKKIATIQWSKQGPG